MNSFLIYTASDPIACGLAEYLKEKKFILQAPEKLWETARVLVDNTNKKALSKALTKYLDQEGIEGIERRVIKIIKVQ